MRNLRNPQLERGEVRIEDIELDIKCRDDIPALLIGLQYLYSQVALRDRFFAFMDECILPGVNRKVGRPGMAMWSILIMGVVKQGLGCDFDRLHELANQHMAIRRFLGHADIGDKKHYRYQTLVDNVSLLNPKLLGKVNQLIVESGHTAVGKKSGAPLRGRCDSFVAESDVHYPTDVNLLWDAMRCMLRSAGRTASKHDVWGLRQWKKLRKSVNERFNKVRKTRRIRPKHVKAYLGYCAELIGRVEALLLELAAKGEPRWKINKITYFLKHAVRQINQVDRRLLKGETIPHNEKVFSIFEPHTRWSPKGKAGRPVEFGVPVCIVECQYQFILHYEIMWEGSDVDFAVPMVVTTKELFPDFCAASFDRGFHSPANRARLDELLVDNVLPKKGYLSKIERDHEQGETFAAMPVSTPLWSRPVNRHSTVTHYQRPNMTHPQEGGKGGEVSEILFFSAKSKRHPSLIYSMQIIPVCLSIVARRKGVSATRRGGLNWTPISLLVGHPCKLFHKSAINNLEHRGLDRVRSKGREGFARTVALSVVALNVHRHGCLLRQ